MIDKLKESRNFGRKKAKKVDYTKKDKKVDNFIEKL